MLITNAFCANPKLQTAFCTTTNTATCQLSGKRKRFIVNSTISGRWRPLSTRGSTQCRNVASPQTHTSFPPVLSNPTVFRLFPMTLSNSWSYCETCVIAYQQSCTTRSSTQSQQCLKHMYFSWLFQLNRSQTDWFRSVADCWSPTTLPLQTLLHV